MNWKAGPPGLKLTIMAIVTASVSSENASAIHLASSLRARLSVSLAPAEAPGVTASTSAPTAGIARVTVR